MYHKLLLLLTDELKGRGRGSDVELVLDSREKCPIETLCCSYHVHTIILIRHFELYWWLAIRNRSIFGIQWGYWWITVGQGLHIHIVGTRLFNCKGRQPKYRSHGIWIVRGDLVHIAIGWILYDRSMWDRVECKVCKHTHSHEAILILFTAILLPDLYDGKLRE